MNLIQKYKIRDDEVLNSYNFMEKSDVIYAASVPTEMYEKNYKNKYNKIVYQQNDHTLFKTTVLNIKENDIIFCNTLFLKQLFNHLNKINNFKNITLITHQADLKINRKLFQLKPECISKWYSVNVDYRHDSLISIPLGIANTKNTKNLTFEDFEKQKKFNRVIHPRVFSSFNINTNYFHRVKLLKIIKKDEFLKAFNQDLDNYIDLLTTSKFTLCPWGNGIDSHRFWEAIYAGSIPISLTHIHYKNFESLPIHLVDDYQLINIQDFKESVVDYEKLTVSWWINKMKKVDNINKSEILKITESEALNQKNINQYHADIKKLNQRKFFLTILRKIHKNTVYKMNLYFGKTSELEEFSY